MSWIGGVAGLLIALGVAGANPPQNLAFEETSKEGDDVPGWFVPPVCAGDGWRATVTEKAPAEGKRCCVLARTREKDAGPGRGFGNVMQTFDAAAFRGKRLTLTAKARLGKGTALAPAGRVQVWCRVDLANQRMGFFDNCADRPVMAEDWQTVKIVGDIAVDAATINVGMMVMGGNGPAYLDDVVVVASEKPASRVDPVRPLSERGLANLEALTRVVGYVRHYYPSDEAAAVDWDHFVVDAIPRVEGAGSAAELATVFKSIFAPIAPAASFADREFENPFDAGAMLVDRVREAGTTCWQHRGFGPDNVGKPGAVYFSERLRTAHGEKDPQGVPRIGECVTERIRLNAQDPNDAVWVRVPIVLYTDDQGTLPHPTTGYLLSPDAPDLTVDARAVRLAGVMLAWNVLQHHFPYFDVIHDDWNAALREALRSAATDADAAAYQLTLERLVTHLHDGHGHVSARELMGRQVFSLPLLLTFVGDEPTVLNAVGDAVPKGVHAGDAVVSIGGTPIGALIDDARAHEPAATEGNFKFRAARRLVRCASADPVEVAFRSSDGKEQVASLKPVAFDRVPAERSGPIVSEPKPGVWYVDLDRATDKDIAAAMPNLAKATGIVFDMRGYPNSFSMGMLGHLSDQRLDCARWEIPMANWPDRRHLEFDHSRWDLPIRKPRLTAKVAFVTDGRAISAAETFLGIVEAYKLAEIVGEPTAGTNGNVNTIKLPGGFSITYTGMKVLKHDGSQHHGIGILPTVPAHRTVAGIAAARDEMLERAIETVSSPRDGPPKTP